MDWKINKLYLSIKNIFYCCLLGNNRMQILYFQAVSSCVCFVLGFLVSIPVGLNRSRHKDHCLLYANLETDGTEITTQGSLGDNLLPGSRLTCDFCIFSGTISLIIALVLLLATLYAILQNGFQTFNMARYIGDTEKRKTRHENDFFSNLNS